MPECRWCNQGNSPKQTAGGKWEHWIVRSVIPARIRIKACKKPPAEPAREHGKESATM